MTANYLPWLVLLAIVAASLVFKGYVKLPRLGGAPPAAAQQSAPTHRVPSNLSDFDSATLGLAFAIAKRAEVERELALAIAARMGEDVKATFSAPFSAPAPAGPTPPPASAPQ